MLDYNVLGGNFVGIVVLNNNELPAERLDDYELDFACGSARFYSGLKSSHTKKSLVGSRSFPQLRHITLLYPTYSMLSVRRFFGSKKKNVLSLVLFSHNLKARHTNMTGQKSGPRAHRALRFDHNIV